LQVPEELHTAAEAGHTAAEVLHTAGVRAAGELRELLQVLRVLASKRQLNKVILTPFVRTNRLGKVMNLPVGLMA